MRPQDEGSGRVALENAAMVGLVMNETIDNFEAANPLWAACLRA